MSKKIIHGEESREKMFAGIEKVAKTVTVTMGPKGRNVILETKDGTPLVTNDGVTIAKEISLKNSFENMGAQLVKDAAEKTNSLAGDGTTTATLLTYAIAKEGKKYLQKGINAVELKNGLNKASDLVIEELEKNTKTIKSKEEIEQVATISAQDPQVGHIIAEAMDIVGNTGIISVEEGQRFGLEVEVTQGMEFQNGYMSHYMITDSEKKLADFKDAPILITDHKISNMKILVPLLEQMMESGKKDLIILAEDIESDALTTIVLNKLKGILNILAVKTPGFGETKQDILNDLSILTGSNLITSQLGMKLEDVSMSDLGSAKNVVSSQQNTTIIGGAGNSKEIEERISEIKEAIDSASGDSREVLLMRLAKLDGGVAVIKVGAASEVEMKEKKLRIEDALNATQAAVEEGVVAGGGVALIKASKALDGISLGNSDQDLAIKILQKVLKYPVKQIATNAGKDAKKIASKILDNKSIEYGYNAHTDTYVNMIEEGIIDPKKVSRIALEQAISLSGMFLTTEAAITSRKDKNDTITLPSLPNMGMGGMPGM
ncbi:chaperonin GroEL [Candidatus Gracilibacteria bacterium]|nr:chaperonin GroEL [Candidatus Gracilibacteria bacterium]